MKLKILFAALLIFVGFAGWQIGGKLSTDATGMAIGILLGVMAGIPTALIILANGRAEVHYHHHTSQPKKRKRLDTAPPQLKNWRVVKNDKAELKG